jgi:hypothetical protein
MRRSILHNAIAFLLAANYFAFQVELFEAEYEQNHPGRPEGCAFVAPAVTWESFDKENASQAFVFDAGLRIDFLFTLPDCTFPAVVTNRPYQPVRDKSPPSASEHSRLRA